MQIIVTDLTRFRRNDIVCLAGACRASGRCIRPQPYVAKSECERLKIWPGAILAGEFTPDAKAEAPHVEDHEYTSLSYKADCSCEEFREALERDLSDSIQDGFGVTLPEGQKYIPTQDAPARSIITVSIDPSQLSVVEDGYNKDKLKIHLTDNDGCGYSYLPLTDLGFYVYASKTKRRDKSVRKLNEMLQEQDELLVRIGLSRVFESGDRIGYWLQVNGVYTFPDPMRGVRQYE